MSHVAGAGYVYLSYVRVYAVHNTMSHARAHKHIYQRTCDMRISLSLSAQHVHISESY